MDQNKATPKFFKDWGHGYIAVRHKGLEKIKRLSLKIHSVYNSSALAKVPKWKTRTLGERQLVVVSSLSK